MLFTYFFSSVFMVFASLSYQMANIVALPCRCRMSRPSTLTYSSSVAQKSIHRFEYMPELILNLASMSAVHTRDEPY